MRTLLFNIGNTHTQMAEWSEGSFAALQTIATERLDECLDAMTDANAREWRYVAACVRPSAAEVLRRHAVSPAQVIFVTAASALDLDFSRVDVSTIGGDRVANAVAGVLLHAPPLIVLDCGTAVTVEVIDKERHFLGGAILPGRLLLRRALRDYTGQLPYVDLDDRLPAPVGTRTVDAIRSGVDLGSLGAVTIILQRIRDAIGLPACPVWVTGGDADYFAVNIPLADVSPAPPLFTLYGVARIADTLPSAAG